MINRRAPRSVVEAKQTLEGLGHQTDELNAHLAKLRQELSDVQSYVDSHRASQLLEANAKLVMAAISAEDIAEQAVSNLREVRHSSMYDGLTCTANRELMFERLCAAIASAKQMGTRIAVMFLDIDHFKCINTTLGHAGGDAVLKIVANRLTSVLRDTDTVSRHGGDEFLILLDDIEDASDAACVASKILAAMDMPSFVGEVSVHISVSLGIAIYPEDGTDIDTLIEKADKAMYGAKAQGDGIFQFHPDQASLSLSADGGKLLTAAQNSALADRESLREARLIDLRDANEQLVMAVLTAQELEARAQDAHRQQIKFMAIVAHELRNPLTPIRMAASLLTDRDTKGKQALQRLQGVIDSQVKHMSRLINDLIDSSRIRTGKLRLQLDIVEIGGILRSAVETCRPAMEARRQQFTLRLPSAPLAFEGDAVRLTQVFSNLLDNAAKYTPESGQISLIFGELTNSMTVTISDNGIGISAEALPHVFDLFVQDTYGLTHSNGGLGIGLAVVKELVEAHGGSVEVKSKGLHLGSEFTVCFPTKSLLPDPEDRNV